MTASQNFTVKYQEKAQKWAEVLSFFPGVSAIFLSGSLAQGRATEKSDIDIFIVTKPGQIFTARFFINACLKLTGQLASEKNHNGQLCPNHFITENNLEIQEKDAYSANLFSHNKCLAGDKRVWKKFVLANQNWVQQFGEKFPQEISLKTQEMKPLNKVKKRIGGGERILKNYQINRIKKHHKSLPKHACIILTDQEIRLHPNPKNRSYL